MKLAPSELSNFSYLGTFGLEFQKIGTQIFYLGILWIEFSKTIVIFEITNLKMVK